jgi:hypothetical protein
MNSSLAVKYDESELEMSKIIIIATYFGKWPVWFPAFLLTCAKNETIEWLFFTDCEVPEVTYPNIRFKPMDLGQLNDLASQKLGFPIQKGTYSQMDLRPAYGMIFHEYFNDFDFWGHCDIDVVWGNIRGFITEEILQNYDIVSSRKDFLAGHLTLRRNEPQTNTLFKVVPAYREILSSSEYRNFDESITSTFLKTLIENDNSRIRVHWPKQMVVGLHELQFTPNGWSWDNGRILDAQHREHIYMHLQDWKKSMTFIDFQVGDHPVRFKVDRLGIRSRRPSVCHFLYENFNQKHVKGLFSKFVRSSLDLTRLLKMVLLVRNIYWAQKLTANSVSGRDVRFDRKTGRLFLKRLGLDITKKQHFLLEGYYWGLSLVDQRKAKFYSEEQGNLVVEVAGLRALIHGPEEIATLKKILIDGLFNFQFSRPAVVLDIGMCSGLTSIFFASHPEVLVVGFEPCQKMYDQALRNITLNPTLSDKISAVRAGIGDSKFKSIAWYPPNMDVHPNRCSPHSDYGMRPKFEYEEIDIEDVADVLGSIVTDYPGRDVVVKIDFNNSECYFDGISEYLVINRLCATGKLELIDIVLVELHKPKPEYDPSVITRQLAEYGFRAFLFAPSDHQRGMLYAVRTTDGKTSQNSDLGSRRFRDIVHG